MIGKDDVRQAVARLAVVWPTLKNRDELRQEIGNAVMAEADKLEPLDVERGVNLLIRTAPTKAKDGGPAWPPGPNEVLGCILKIRAERVDLAPRMEGPKNTGPIAVTNRRCCRSECGGVLDYLRAERVLRCQRCRSVQVREWIEGRPRIHLGSAEFQALTFSDEPPEDGIDAMEAVRKMLAENPKKVSEGFTKLLAA